MKLTKYLALTLWVSMLALVFVSGYGFWQLFQFQARFAYVQNNTIPAIVDLAQATAQMSDIRASTLAFALTTDETQRADRLRKIAIARQHFDEILSKYSTDHILDKNDREMIESDKANIAAFSEVHAKFIAAATNAPSGYDVNAALESLTSAVETMVKGLKDQTDYNIKLANSLGKKGDSDARWSLWVLGLITIATLLLKGILASNLYQRIRHGLSDIQNILGSVSESLDLTQRAPVKHADEIGQTAGAFNQLIERISQVLGTVRISSNSVCMAAKHISISNADLSARTEAQAASLEETAASMEELTSTVQNNADSARQASALTANAAELALKGQGVVSRVVDTMSEIDESSDRIADITSIIEGIAFQTNILALNAAVEAARAGEQGRGFAVVASEVRNLAQRSSSAAKEIKDLIAASVEKIHTGSALANEAGEAISQVTTAVGHAADLINEIAAASQEQSQGIDQVNQAITLMDQVTQQNATQVEEAAAAAKLLEEQGAHLDGVVRIFHIGDVTPPTVTAPPESREPRPVKESFDGESRIRAHAKIERPVFAETALNSWQAF